MTVVADEAEEQDECERLAVRGAAGLVMAELQKRTAFADLIAADIWRERSARLQALDAAEAEAVAAAKPIGALTEALDAAQAALDGAKEETARMTAAAADGGPAGDQRGTAQRR